MPYRVKEQTNQAASGASGRTREKTESSRRHKNTKGEKGPARTTKGNETSDDAALDCMARVRKLCKKQAGSNLPGLAPCATN